MPDGCAIVKVPALGSAPAVGGPHNLSIDAIDLTGLQGYTAP